MPNLRFWLQTVYGNGCFGRHKKKVLSLSPLSAPAANKNTLEMVQYGVEGSSTFLECQARSPHAVIKWHLQRDNSDRRKEVGCHTPGGVF